eukprot:TRINITY_DN1073_c1_g2_i1.p1 TRINITY_DN1073_c1_g2~~TRINITY_DN1073_c1_g2_i1.p1  ORF type:complete len:219 (+),score=63.35 TRINITY_DN1073_c1_g2_i1:70-657(+)
MDKAEFKNLLSRKQGSPCTSKQAEVIDNLNVKEAARIWEMLQQGQDYLGELGRVARSKGQAYGDAFSGEKFAGEPSKAKGCTADNFDGEKFPNGASASDSATPGKMPYKDLAIEVLEAWLLKYGPSKMACEPFKSSNLGYDWKSSWQGGDEWNVAMVNGEVAGKKREFNATFTMVFDPRDKKWMIRCDHFKHTKL